MRNNKRERRTSGPELLLGAQERRASELGAGLWGVVVEGIARSPAG